jgi:hypothetical protein
MWMAHLLSSRGRLLFRVPHPSRFVRRVGRSFVAHRALAPTFVISRKFVRMSSCRRTTSRAPSGRCFCARWGGARDLLLLFRVPHTPFLRVGPRFLSLALLYAGAPSFVPALRAGGACALEDVAKGGSVLCSPPRARTQICHPEEVRPHVFMQPNDEPGPPAGAAFAPVGVGEGSASAFSGAPHAVLACGSSFSVSRRCRTLRF